MPVGSSARISAGLGDQGPGDRDPLLLAAGQLAGAVLDPVGQPDPVAGPSMARAAPLAAAARRRSTSGSSTLRHADSDGEQVELLEDEPDAPVADLGQRRPRSCG